MLHLTIDTPGVVTMNDDGIMYQLWGLAALGPGHILNTVEFIERRPDLGEMGRARAVPWDTQVPPASELFAASGNTTEIVGQFWVGWLLGRTLSMLAVKQEHPFETRLVDGEVPIFPPVMDRAGRVALYSWRPGAGETALWRRTFVGRIHQPVTMTAEELVRVPGRPLATRAGVIPSLSTTHAILGWVEDVAEGAVVGAALIEGDQARVFRSEPIGGSAAFARQRLGVWAESYGCVEIDAVVQSREAPFTYRLARFSIGQNAPQPKQVCWSCQNPPPSPFALSPEAQRLSMALTDLALPPGELHAVALEHPKQRLSWSLRQIFLTRDGRLHLAEDIGESPSEVRRNISLDDPLAVVTGSSAAYWGVRHPDGSITLEEF